MENARRYLFGSSQSPIAAYAPHILVFHGVTNEIIGVVILAGDLSYFHNTSQRFQVFYYIHYVPQIIRTWPEEITSPWPEEITSSWPEEIASPCPERVQFEFLTLPIDERTIGDGDGFNAYVNITEPRELKLLPKEVKKAIKMRKNAHAAKDLQQEELAQNNVIAFGYRFIYLRNQQEVLARKYQIRLRGVDAPEIGMPYGNEAKQALVKLIRGKRLKICVYNEDIYGRSVGDVYYNNLFIQEQLLKIGCVWHYAAFDHRQEFSKCQKEAQDARRGLWSSTDPEEPSKWRKNNPNPHDH